MTKCNECKYMNDNDVYVGWCGKHRCDMYDTIHCGCSKGEPKEVKEKNYAR